MATSWTNTNLTNATVKGNDITEIRDAINDIITNSNVSGVSNPSVDTSTTIKKANMVALQTAINALETKFSNNCNCVENCYDCNQCTECKQCKGNCTECIVPSDCDCGGD